MYTYLIYTLNVYMHVCVYECICPQKRVLELESQLVVRHSMWAL